MISKTQFQEILGTEETLIIDGALATELEQRGLDLNHALWSAKVLRDDPASIQKVHYDYYAAGANIAITASYQAGLHGLMQHFDVDEAEGRQLIRRSVEVACAARGAVLASPSDGHSTGARRSLLVAGSVGPYGAFLANGSEYRGDYQRTIDEFKDFHRARIQVLLESGADLLALETMPNLLEIEALLVLLDSEFPSAIAWLSCTMKDTMHLADGTPWRDVLDLVNKHEDRIIAFGVNCVAISSTARVLRNIRCHTKLPLMCYPNSGEIWGSATHTWHGTRPDELLADPAGSDEAASKLAVVFNDWTKAGARLIGGCCRTGPAFVKALRNHLSM